MTPDPRVLAQSIVQKCSVSDLFQLAGSWAYPKGPLPNFQSCSHLTKKQVEQLIEWKLEDRWKVARTRFGQNHEEEVDIVTRAAFELAVKPGQAKTAVAVLRALSGVDIAVGSAILTAKYPKQYGIIDRKVWTSLLSLTNDQFFDRGSRQYFKLPEFQLYIDLLQILASQTNMSARDLDKALWMYK